MSDKRYINLRVTPEKWENEYFGDFEAPIALYPAPSRPEPTPTPTPSTTPQPTPTVTPSITPTSTPAPTKTPTVTPSISSTPASSPTPTLTSTPTFTPTPSATPPEQFYILAENTNEILTEGSDNLIVETIPGTMTIPSAFDPTYVQTYTYLGVGYRDATGLRPYIKFGQTGGVSYALYGHNHSSYPAQYLAYDIGSNNWRLVEETSPTATTTAALNYPYTPPPELITDGVRYVAPGTYDRATITY